MPLGNVTFNTNALFGGAYPYADVQAHGAAGDGTTDDTTAFQNTITAAGAQGTVAVPYTAAGYKITGTLNINKVNFIGLNGKAILKPSGTLTNLFTIGDATAVGTVENTRLANIQVLLDNAPTGMAVVKSVRGFSNWTVENFDVTRLVDINRAAIIAAANAGFNLQIDPNNPDAHSYNIFRNIRLQYVHPAFDADWSSYTAQKGTNLFSSNVFIDIFIARCYSGLKLVGIGNRFEMGDFAVTIADFVSGTDYLVQVKGTENWLGIGFDGGITAPAPFGQAMQGNTWTGYNLGLAYSNGNRAVQTIDVNGNVLSGSSVLAYTLTQQLGFHGLTTPVLPNQQIAQSGGGTVTPNIYNGPYQEIDVNDGTAFTIANPSPVLQTGQLFYLVIVQNNVNPVGTITWGSAYKFNGGVLPPLPTANNQSSRILFFADGSGNLLEVSRSTAAGAATMALKKGTAGNYTTTSATYVDVDATNLSYPVTVPVGQKVLITVGGVTVQDSSAGAIVQVALTDGTTVLAEIQQNNSGLTNADATFPFAYIFTGDGASHTFKLRWQTSAGTATMLGSSATLCPMMTFLMMAAS